MILGITDEHGPSEVDLEEKLYDDTLKRFITMTHFGLKVKLMGNGLSEL